MPEYGLQQPAEFDAQEKLWYWRPEEGECPLALGDAVRLRVVDVKFREIETPAQLKLKGKLQSIFS